MKRKSGTEFTLIELLTVISIIAILASMLMPALRNAREKANASICQSNEKQLTNACLMYASDFNDWIPTSWTASNTAWHRTYIAPNGYAPPQSNPPSGIWKCPSEKFQPTAVTLTHYGLSRFTISWGHWRKLAQITKPSETVLIFDACIDPNLNAYSYYQTLTADQNIKAQRHNGGRNYSFADGHTEWAKPLRALNDFIWNVP
ncbi:MAG: hypothetical protein A2020_12970 [Lentisphaerae bacterium GWF2_45_14]|nr:MAG: hypothetical protein A2020_12970 [Lentisphaerae bacterium GWF2_45_14]